jgi:hypothetical protein
VRAFPDSLNTVPARSQIPNFCSEAPAAESGADSAEFAAPDADLDGATAMLAEGIEAAMASICAFNALAPKPFASL